MTEDEGIDFGYGIKSTLAQCLVLTTTYLLNAQQGIDMMMPTLIIDAMNSRDSMDTIPEITEKQLSWIGSLIYLSPPIGNLLLSLYQARMGHRACILLTNLIQLSSVSIVFFPITVTNLCACSILMGLSTGFACGLSVSYSGEVCEPKLRGTLTSVMNVFYFGGYFFASTAYAITNDWKMSLLITVIIPLANIVTLLPTPDSPMWLLTKGRTDKARIILRKLRGCVSEEKCAKEFQEMVQYVSQSFKLDESKGKHSSSDNEQFSHPGLWKPLKLIMIYLFFSNILSGTPFIPYLVRVFRSFNTPMKAAWATSVYMAFSIVGNLFTILLVHRLGKRLLVLSTITICSVCYLVIGVVGIIFADSELNSWTKSLLFFVSTFSSSLGIMPIGWIYMSEVFPMKSKNVGSSIGSAVYFLLSFLMTKFYLDLEELVGFYYTFVLFGTAGLGSLVYFYICLPETENKTLKEIAEHFQLKPV